MEILSKVSLLVTCFNKELFIERFTNLLFPYLNLIGEVIIVDDCSNDSSSHLLQSFFSPFSNVRIIRNSINLGSAASRNIALSAATKDFLFFVDIDDEVNIPILAEMVEQAIEDQVDICRGHYSILPIRDNVVEPLTKLSLQKDNPSAVSDIVDLMGFWRYLYLRNFIVENEVLFLPEKSLLKDNPFILDDVFWLIQIACANPRISVFRGSDPVYIYTPTAHTKASWRKFQKQAALFPKAALFVYSAVNQEKLKLDELKVYCFKKTITHVTYLNFSQWLRVLPRLIELYFKSNRKVTPNLIPKFMFILKISFRAFRNSLHNLI